MGQQCVPVKDHKFKCEPQSVVTNLGLAPDYSCLKSRQALDQVLQEPTGTWKLLMRSDGEPYMERPIIDVGVGALEERVRPHRLNANNPGARNYAALHNIQEMFQAPGDVEQFRGADGKFLFRMKWSKSGVDNVHVWKQTSRVSDEGPVKGYESIDERAVIWSKGLSNFNRCDNLPELGGDDDNYAKNLKACFGECDEDSQCAAGLKCFQRSKGETIPGCRGPGGGESWDYCYDPNFKCLDNQAFELHVAVPRAADAVAPTRGTIKDVSKSGGNDAKLVSNLNSVVGDMDVVYTGDALFNDPHGTGFYDGSADASKVPIGQLAGHYQLVVDSTNPTSMGPAHVCPKQGCPFVPEDAIAVTQQTFFWSDASGWKQKGWNKAGVPVEGQDITIPKGWHVILDVPTNNLKTLTVRGVLELANGGTHTGCMERAGRKNNKCVSLKTEKLCSQKILAGTCEWKVTPFPPLKLNAEKIQIEGGRVFAGNKTHPYTHDVEINMMGEDSAVPLEGVDDVDKITSDVTSQQVNPNPKR